MTNPNKTHITLVCDRTGSMDAIRTDAEGAVNSFLEQQKAEPGECSLLFVDFDAPGGWATAEEPWYRIIHDGPISTATVYSLHPRGNTALLDALGAAITATGERLSNIAEDDRPGKVIFVFQTDGQENSSHDWTGERVRDAIKRQEETYGWTFLPLGVGADAFSGLAQVLIGTQSVSNITRTRSGGISAVAGYQHTNDVVSTLRSAATPAAYASAVASAGADVDDEGNVIPDASA